MIRILFVGDVMGKVGRRMLARHLEPVIDRERVDFVVANLENAAGGFGVTPQVMAELDGLPVHVWTSGNHIWDKKEGVPLLDAYPTLIRPANYPEGNPGRGWVTGETAAGVPVAVVNLQGQAMMPPSMTLTFFQPFASRRQAGLSRLDVPDLALEQCYPVVDVPVLAGGVGTVQTLSHPFRETFYRRTACKQPTRKNANWSG